MVNDRVLVGNEARCLLGPQIACTKDALCGSSGGKGSSSRTEAPCELIRILSAIDQDSCAGNENAGVGIAGDRGPIAAGRRSSRDDVEALWDVAHASLWSR